MSELTDAEARALGELDTLGEHSLGGACSPNSSRFPASPARTLRLTRNTGTRTTCDGSVWTSTCGSATSLRFARARAFPERRRSAPRRGESSAALLAPRRPEPGVAGTHRRRATRRPRAVAQSRSVHRPRHEWRDVWARRLRHEGGADRQPGGCRGGPAFRRFAYREAWRCTRW